MNIVASAPGKVVLLGEYAVLEGAPALSMAVDRRATARISLRNGERCAVHARDILEDAAELTFSAEGLPQWPGAAAARSLALVDQVLRGMAQRCARPEQASKRAFDLHLDTSAFFDETGTKRHKLGLGSSAALTVALASALSEYFGEAAATADRERWLHRLLQIHREFQAGQGSGVDVATSLFGGLIEYRLNESRPQACTARWPQTLNYCFVWSGRSASTPRLLGMLQTWREAHNADYAARMAELTVIAEAGATASRNNDAAALLQAIAAYAKALRQLGDASGLGIFSAEHLHLAELARDSAVVYKSCGAGGGDVGAAFSLDSEALQHFAGALGRQGFRRLPMTIDEDGLRLEFMETE